VDPDDGTPPAPAPDRSGGPPAPDGSRPDPGGLPSAEGTMPGGDGLDLDRVAAELAAVEAALGRLDEGRYGTCAACDGPIADDLLAAEPTRTTCGAHQPA